MSIYIYIYWSNASRVCFLSFFCIKLIFTIPVGGSADLAVDFPPFMNNSESNGDNFFFAFGEALDKHMDIVRDETFSFLIDNPEYMLDDGIQVFIYYFKNLLHTFIDFCLFFYISRIKKNFMYKLYS